MRLMPLVLLALLAVSASTAIAQTMRGEAGALAQAKAESAAAEARAAQLDSAAEAAADAADRARADAAAIAARIQVAEADIDAAQARVRLIERLRVRQRERLAARQGPIVRLIAALQTIARRPPALALVQPGSLADMVHVRSLLASTLPVIRARTAGLRAELARAERLRIQAAQALLALTESQQRLQTQQLALGRIESSERLRSRSLTDSSMFEQDKALAMGEEARDIVDLMRVMDDQAGVRGRLASLPGPMLRPAIPGGVPPPPATRRRASAGRPPAYRLPVVGDVVTGLGEIAESGVRARGLTIATRPSAQAIAPNSGLIAYAGPFRGYGQIVIIDHGGGWTTLVAGLADVSVKVGERINRGGPIGRAGSVRPRVTVELRRGGNVVDIPSMMAAG